MLKRLAFAQFSERNFGGNPLAGGPKLLQINHIYKFLAIKIYYARINVVLAANVFDVFPF